MDSIKKFLDEEGKIKTWPSKHEMKNAVLGYLSTKFEEDTYYTEKQVNEVIKQWHTFGDFFLLRRGMIEKGFMERTDDGMRYWRKKV